MSAGSAAAIGVVVSLVVLALMGVGIWLIVRWQDLRAKGRVRMADSM